MKILSGIPRNFKCVLTPLRVTNLFTGNAYALSEVPEPQEVAQFSQLSATTKFHVDNNLPFPVRVRAIRDGRSDIWQTLNPGGSFRGNIDRRAGVRIVVYGPENCGDTEIMPSSYARVYTTETFRIRSNGIKRVVADKTDPWSRVAGVALTGVAMYYAPEYGPTILSAVGVKEAKLASCSDSPTSLSCLNGIVSYAEDIKRQYGDNSVAYNQCLRTAHERAQKILSQSPQQKPSHRATDVAKTGQTVALDANIGREVYLHPQPDSNNLNHLWKLKDSGSNEVMILNDVTGATAALDANHRGQQHMGGLYMNPTVDPENPNQRWEVRQIDGDYYLIINKALNKALDANGGRQNPYLNSNVDPSNHNLHWRLTSVGDYKMITPRVAEVCGGPCQP